MTPETAQMYWRAMTDADREAARMVVAEKCARLVDEYPDMKPHGLSNAIREYGGLKPDEIMPGIPDKRLVEMAEDRAQREAEANVALRAKLGHMEIERDSYKANLREVAPERVVNIEASIAKLAAIHEHGKGKP